VTAKSTLALLFLSIPLAVTVAFAGACRERPAARDSGLKREPSVATRPAESPVPDSLRARVPDPEPILGIELPTDVASIVATLGKPDTVELPDGGDPSPWGQTYRWNPQDVFNTFTALGNAYDTLRADYGAQVNLIALRANKRGFVTKTVHGFELNRTSRPQVEGGLQGVTQTSTLRCLGDCPAGSYYRDALKYEKDGLYTYFLFGAGGRLVGVAQATFDVDMAD
jgi:hypothetical protein